MRYTLEWVYFKKYMLFTCAGYLRGMNIYRVTDSLVIAEMSRVQKQCTWGEICWPFLPDHLQLHH